MNRVISKYCFYLPVTVLKGEMVLPYMPSYRKFQSRTPDEIKTLQLERLKNIVKYAYENSIFYKREFDAFGVVPSDIKKLDDIKKIPLISKEDLVNSMADISVQETNFLNSRKTTGGSTGQAVTLFKNPSALARERAATWRSYEWAGVTMGSPQARFWGVPLETLDSIKYKLIDVAANRKRYSAFNINACDLMHHYNSIVKFKPAYIYGYVSFIDEFSGFLSQNNLTLPSSIKSVITTSEVLTDISRENIEKSTGLKVYNEYGCGEVGSIAHECEHGSMHIMDDNLLLEIDENGFNKGEGEIIVTDFFNRATPLIRYRLGDFARLSTECCACGRGLRVIEKIHGRAYDLISDSSGNKIHPEYIMYIFESVKEKFNCIQQFQFIQIDKQTYKIKVVKKNNYIGTVVEPYITELLTRKVSPHSQIIFEGVDAIEREKSGKLRLIKSELSADSVK